MEGESCVWSLTDWQRLGADCCTLCLRVRQSVMTLWHLSTYDTHPLTTSVHRWHLSSYDTSPPRTPIHRQHLSTYDNCLPKTSVHLQHVSIYETFPPPAPVYLRHLSTSCFLYESDMFLLDRKNNQLLWTAVIGLHSHSGANSVDVQSRKVDRIIMNRHYSKITKEADIAMMHLQQPVNFTSQ